MIIVNDFQPLTIITERSILDAAVFLDPSLLIKNYMALKRFAKVRRSSPDNIKKKIAFNLLEVLLTLHIRVRTFSFVNTSQKMKFSIKDFFSKCDQIQRTLQIWSHSLKEFHFLFSVKTKFIRNSKIKSRSLKTVMTQSASFTL